MITTMMMMRVVVSITLNILPLRGTAVRVVAGHGRVDASAPATPPARHSYPRSVTEMRVDFLLICCYGTGVDSAA
jgi:hypothetical protein